MRPLAILLGIVMGSTVSLAVGLALTWVVFMLMPEHAERLAPEREPLARAIGLFTMLAAASAASFYGALNGRRWRHVAYAVLVALLGLTVRAYWPA
jgi:ABC-type antimicrobial peptide transport system permease subunit